MNLIEEVKGSAICYADNVFEQSLCRELIIRFESSKEISPGILNDGRLDPAMKKSTDLPLTGKQWEDINRQLMSPFTATLEVYANRYPEMKKLIKWKSAFQMMKYEQGSGYFNWHSDTNYSEDEKKLIATIVYLNTVDQGGETEFREFGVAIMPVECRMAIFPANWTHVHRSVMPSSGPKYILSSFLGR